MAEPDKYAGKRVLVTGSGTGIGKGVAIAFAEAGASVAFHYSRSDAGAKEAVEKVRGFGGAAEAFGADFRDAKQAIRLVDQAVDFLGGIDVVVNNAGVTANMPYTETTIEQYDLMMNVNVRAMYFVGQAAAKHMVKNDKGGVILNVSSVHGFQGCPEHSVYAGTKGAIISMSRAMAVEMMPAGVRVNVIAPGGVQVENWNNVGGGFTVQSIADRLPAGFVSVPQDIGELAMFLASDEARYIVGQTIVIDGGQIAVMGGAPRYTENWGGNYVDKA